MRQTEAGPKLGLDGTEAGGCWVRPATCVTDELKKEGERIGGKEENAFRRIRTSEEGRLGGFYTFSCCCLFIVVSDRTKKIKLNPSPVGNEKKKRRASNPNKNIFLWFLSF